MDNAAIPLGGHLPRDEKLRAAGVILMAPDGRALFLRRSIDGDHQGEWAFPGGKLEGDEDPKQAAVRELEEETKIKIAPAKLRQVDHTDKDGVEYTTFIAHVPSPVPTPQLNNEHDGHRWRRLSETPQPSHPGVAMTAKKLTARDDWNEKDHPRGQPGNSGQFGPGGGGGSKAEPAKKTEAAGKKRMTHAELEHETRNGSGRFEDYHDAHTAAVLMARKSGKEVGIEPSPKGYYNKPGFRVFPLPKAENRYGFETRAQVVRPDEPISGGEPEKERVDFKSANAKRSNKGYQPANRTPELSDLPAGAIKEGTNREEWEKLSPGMRREIERSAKKLESKPAPAAEPAKEPGKRKKSDTGQNKKETVKGLLEKGVSSAELRSTLKGYGWTPVSPRTFAKTLGVELKEYKEGGVTKFKVKKGAGKEDVTVSNPARVVDTVEMASLAGRLGAGKASADDQKLAETLIMTLMRTLPKNGSLELPGHDAKTPGLRETIEYPPPKGPGGERVIDTMFARGTATDEEDPDIDWESEDPLARFADEADDEDIDRETAIAPQAAELNSTTMDVKGYLDFTADKHPNSLQSFVLRHGRPFQK